VFGNPGLNFSSQLDAIYHAYKHQDATELYMESKPESPEESMLNYLDVIKNVIHYGSLSEMHPPRPDQFDDGRIFTFEYNYRSQLNLKVIVKHHCGNNSFLLTCH
jgi:hypothetical protein